MFIVIQKSELIANKANYRNRDTEGSGVIKGAREKGFPSPPRIYLEQRRILTWNGWQFDWYPVGSSGIATSSNRDSRVHRRFILIYTWSWCRLPRNWIIALRPCTFFMSANSTRGDSPHPRPRFIVLPRLVICGFRDKAYRRI